MDIRAMIIQKVMEALCGRADEEVPGTMQDVLVMQLNAYEVLERYTEVAVRDDSAEGLIPRNPCAALAKIKSRKMVKKPYSAAEMERIRKACGNIRDLALVDFLHCTGCRVLEVSRLDISDVDFERMECVVLGKGNKERSILSGTCGAAIDMMVLSRLSEIQSAKP